MKVLNSKEKAIGGLTGLIECHVIEERNGEFELQLTHSAREKGASNLVRGNILICNASPTLTDQYFRIYRVSKEIYGKIMVNARHISFDLARDITEGLDIKNQSCEYVLNTLFRNSQFSKDFRGVSDIINAQDFSIKETNLLSAIGGFKGSILDTFGTGAEILRDNKTINVLNRRGRDNGVTIEYAKNLTGFELTIDEEGLATRIKPFARYTPEGGEETIILSNPRFIDSPLIFNYETPFISSIDFTDKFKEGEIPTPSKLKALAEKHYKDTKCDIVKQNYQLDFIPLSKCVGFDNINDDISLCDEVTVINSLYNITVKNKVIKTVFNVLTNRIESVELGEPRTTLGDIIGSGGESGKGEKGDKGDQGEPGADGNIGDFPDSLPTTPTLTGKVYGFANAELEWTFDNKVYYTYELYASREKDFIPNTFDLIFEGQASTFLNQLKPNETWYYKVCAVNTHGRRGAFSNQVEITTSKIDDLSNYVDDMAIGDALIGELRLDRGWFGELRGNYIDAKQLSVTDGNGKRTLDIDSFGNVALDVTTLKISSKDIEQTMTEDKAELTMAIEKSVEVAKKYVDDTKLVIDKEMSDLTFGIVDLSDYVNGAFKDGIIDETEKGVLKQKLTDLDIEKADVISQADSLANESELGGTVELGELINTKNNFNIAHTNLVNRINSVITPNKGLKSNFVVSPTSYKFTPDEKIVIQYSGENLTYGYLYGVGGETIYSESGDASSMTFPHQKAGVYRECYIGTYDSNTNWIESNRFDITIEKEAPSVIPVTSVSLSHTSYKFTTLNATLNLTYNIEPSDATDKRVEWLSTNPNIASVSNGGVVTSRANGNCTIMIRTVDGGKSSSCDITVEKEDTSIPVSNIVVSPTNKVCYVNDSFSIKSTIYPNNATNKNITWTSSDYNIADVDTVGRVTAISKGNATIQATTHNNKVANCTVTVEEKSDNQLTQAFQEYKIKLVDLRESMNAATLKIAEVKATTKFEELKVYTDRELTIATTNIKDNKSAIEVLKDEISLAVTGTELENTVITIKTDIEKAKSEAIEYADDLKVATDREINDVATSVSDLNTTMNSSFKDGVISEAEAKAIKENLKRCEKEKLEADKQFNVLYNDLALEGEARNNLYYAKVEYDTTYTDLTEYIKEVIADNKATTEEIKNVDSKNSIYNSANAILVQSVSEATKSIEDKKKEEAINSANDYTTTEITKTNETIAGIDIKVGEITSKVEEVQGQVTEVDGIVTSNTERINSAEEKITPEAVITTVTSSKTYTDDLTGKVSTDEVVSSINQTAEAIKIKANKIELNGATTIGDGGRKVLIENANYTVHDSGSQRAFFGFKNMGNSYDKYVVPKLALGAYGYASQHNYFTVIPYRGGDNPQNLQNAYVDIAYHCISDDDWSNIKMYDGGDIRLAPIKNLEITTNHVDGSYGGAEERRLALFSSDKSKIFNSNLQIGCIRNKDNGMGLILGDDSHSDSNKWARVRVNTDSAGAKFFRPATQTGDIGCGSTSFPWKNVVTKTYYATDNIVNNPCSKALVKSGYNILDSIEFIQPLNIEEPTKIDVSSITGTVYAPIEEGTQAIDTTELLKLALIEIKQLKERVKILENK